METEIDESYIEAFSEFCRHYCLDDTINSVKKGDGFFQIIINEVQVKDCRKDSKDDNVIYLLKTGLFPCEYDLDTKELEQLECFLC